MKPGKLRFNLVIKNPTYADAGSGERTETYAEVGTIWGNIEDLSAQERVYAATLGSFSTHKITTRYTSLITSKSRLYYGTREFYVTGVMNTENRNRELNITATEKI